MGTLHFGINSLDLWHYVSCLCPNSLFKEIFFLQGGRLFFNTMLIMLEQLNGSNLWSQFRRKWTCLLHQLLSFHHCLSSFASPRRTFSAALLSKSPLSSSRWINIEGANLEICSFMWHSNSIWWPQNGLAVNNLSFHKGSSVPPGASRKASAQHTIMTWPQERRYLFLNLHTARTRGIREVLKSSVSEEP